MRLSVALCTYNGEKYIREQLLSIRNQTMQVDEIIVSDDCSKDKTIAIIDQIARKYDLPVRIFINPTNHGCRRNFEKAVCRCSGDLIFLSDQDDIWLPTKVETIVAYFNQHPEKNLVFTDAILVNPGGVDCYGQTLFQVVGMDSHTKKLFDDGYAWEALSINCRVTGATCALRASLLPYCLPFSPNIVHDETIAIASTVRNGIGYIDQCLIKYRQHDKQAVGLSMSMNRPAKQWETTDNIMMWHDALIEPFDKCIKDKLNFIYRRFWAVRSPWALLRITRSFLQGEYREYYEKHRSVFLWDIKARFLYLFDKLRTIRKIRIAIERN